MSLRRLRTLGSAAVLLAMLSSGSGLTVRAAHSGQDAATRSGRAAHAPITLVWYERVSGQEQAYEHAVIKLFEKQNPGIHIQLTTTPWNQWDEKLSTLFAAGDAPDIFSNHGANGFMDMTLRGMSTDLTPFIKANHFDMSVFWPRSLYATQVNGKQYALPYMIGGTYIAYNADLFKKAGVRNPPVNWDDPSWTWPQFFNVAGKLTKHAGGVDQWGITNLNPWSPPENAWFTGGDFFDRTAYELTGIPTKVHLACPANVAGLQLNIDAMFKYKVAPTEPVFNSLSSRGNPFLAGNFGMDMNGLWVFSDATNPSRKFNLGFAAVPHLPGAKPVDAFWSDPLIIGSRSKHPQEAFKFISFLTTPQAERIYIDLVNWPPSRKDSYEYWVNMMAHHTVNTPAQIRQLFDGSLRYGRMSADLRLKWYLQLNQVWTGEIDKAYLGKESAAKALADAQTAIVNTYANHQVMVSVAPCNDTSNFDPGPIKGH